MKVLIAFVFALGTVSALGSGPYLPSGWRPKGPAFFLPSEVQKLAPELKTSSIQPEKPLKEAILSEDQDQIQETEASGSDFLREYGPPKNLDVISITEQALPELETERPFAATAKSVEASVAQEQDETETTPEPKVPQESVESETEKQVSEDVTTAEVLIEKNSEDATEKGEEISVRSFTENSESNEVRSDGESEIDGGSLEYLPPAINEVEDKSVDTLISVNPSGSSAQVDDVASLEYLPPAVDQAEEKVEDATPLYQANLETQGDVNEESFPPINKTEQSEADNNEDKVSNEIVSVNESKALDDAVVIEAKPIEDGSGFKSTPKVEEPIGFREYGPPRVDDAEKNPEEAKIENNETRRRRFLSKFEQSRRIKN